MSGVLLDTHVWAWTLLGEERISEAALDVIRHAESVSVSAISLYEIGQKVRLGKWPEMQPYIYDLLDIAEQQGTKLLPVSPMAFFAAADFRWDHRDPFDRTIAATAIVERLTLISADTVFDTFDNSGVWAGRIW